MVEMELQLDLEAPELGTSTNLTKFSESNGKGLCMSLNVLGTVDMCRNMLFKLICQKSER